MKSASFRYEVHMASESFRDILAGFLEENEAISPRETAEKASFQAQNPSENTQISYENPYFSWEKPAFSNEKAARKAAYGRPAQAAEHAKPAVSVMKVETAPPPAAAQYVEPSWTVEQLSATERTQIQGLVQLGARELADGRICLSRVKKAHRRLAKRLHPDMAPATRADAGAFLRLQSIYEGLSKSLAKRASDSACGNESASAPESRRQDAA